MNIDLRSISDEDLQTEYRRRAEIERNFVVVSLADA